MQADIYKDAYVKLFIGLINFTQKVVIEGNGVSEGNLKSYLTEDLPVTSQLDAEVVVYLADGLTVAKISRRLNKNSRTMEKHIQNLHKRYGVSNSAQLVAVFFRNGWIK